MTLLSGLSSSSSLYDWLNWQENCHPKEIDLGLERVQEVYKRLNIKPTKNTVTITVAGTNGKGSSVAMLEAILLAAGYSVGVYSTPHLHTYNERIKINGEPVVDSVITAAFSSIDAVREDTSLSYFEFGTLAALYVFDQHQVDVQILEVGLGGRLDAVNIVDADAALITRIGIDHVDWLGSDIEKIAFEKAGIFRPLQYAVCGDRDVPRSLINHAETLKTNLLCAGRDYDVLLETESWELIAKHPLAGTYPRPVLEGDHQVDNAAAVITLLNQLSQELPVNKTHLKNGLNQISLLGRMQLIIGEPSVLLDVAHNPQSAQVLAEYIAAYNHQGETRVVFSILADKDLKGVLLPFMGKVKKWYLAPINSTRAKQLEEITKCLKDHGNDEYIKHSSIASAFDAAKNESAAGDLIVCFGSFYVVEACLETL